MRVRVMSKSVALSRPAGTLSLTDEEIAELVGVAIDGLPESEKQIDDGAALQASPPEKAFLGSRWGLQSPLH
jgi:hypothetical protein